jgi:nicotinamidase-related amidase
MSTSEEGNHHDGKPVSRIMENTALLVVDVQTGLADPSLGTRNNPQAEANIARLLAAWRRQRRPLVHIRHCSVEPDSPLRLERPGNAFKTEAQPLPGEKEFTKSVNSAFVGTELEEFLRRQGITSLVIVGLTTDHCVSASTRTAADLGFQVTLASDATAAFERRGHDGVLHAAEDIHQIHLASLHGEFCTVRSTDEILEATA